MSTVAENMVSVGTGGLHVDPCRIGHGSGDGQPVGPSIPNFKNQVYGLGFGGGRWDQSKGRWPANLILEHLGGCQEVGTRQVQGHRGYPNGPGGKSMHYASEAKSSEVRPGAWAGHADEDGLETVTTWECQSGCPVGTLDRQTEGTLQSSKGAYSRQHGAEQFLGSGLGDGRVDDPNGITDSGGASRFFKQVKS